MRTLLIALLTVLSTAAFAEEVELDSANSGATLDCSHFYNISRINPTEFSERQKCLINKYHADEVNGYNYGYVWIRVGDDIVSMQRSSFRLNKKEAIFAELERKANQLLIDKAAEELEEQERILKIKLEGIRSQLAQFYGLFLVTGTKPNQEQSLHILDLMEQEEYLTLTLYEGK